jgi:hypothetical protein
MNISTEYEPSLEFDAEHMQYIHCVDQASIEVCRNGSDSV